MDYVITFSDVMAGVITLGLGVITFFIKGWFNSLKSSTDELKEIWKVNAVYEPDADNEAVPATIERWHKAVKCSMGWAK